MPYGFIGDPATDENQFDPNLPVSGITGWTGTLTPEQAARLPWNAGVQPAGGMYDIGGNAQTLRNLGVDETAIDLTIYEPEQMIQAGKTLLESAHNVPDKIIKQLEDQGRAEAKRFQNLVINNQSDIFAAGQATMVPWLNRVKQTAAEHRYREGMAKPLQKVKFPDGSLGTFDPMSGEFKVSFQGEEKIAPEYQSALKKAMNEWAAYASGVYGDPYSPDIQSRLKNAWDAVMELRLSANNKLGKVPTIKPSGSATTNSLPRILSIRPRQ